MKAVILALLTVSTLADNSAGLYPLEPKGDPDTLPDGVVLGAGAKVVLTAPPSVIDNLEAGETVVMFLVDEEKAGIVMDAIEEALREDETEQEQAPANQPSNPPAVEESAAVTEAEEPAEASTPATEGEKETGPPAEEAAQEPPAMTTNPKPGKK